ncbi:MAG: 50S ribosomal protein L3 [Proteobacteria bacterium]|nr:50S ribosomal protein L3 [Pseudomonadota bacterium]
MCKGILGIKLGMTSIFDSDGNIIPVTVLQAGPCVVTQIKTESTDGYNALQIGFGTRKDNRTSKPLKGHLEKSGGKNCRHIKEFQVDNPMDYSLGQEISLDLFNIGEIVNITGTSKGRGFTGVIKRHGFSGGRKTHGSRCHRIPGSVGCSAWPSRITKGKKMPGHYGVDRKTIRNLKIVAIRPEDNLILVNGPVPGSQNGLLEINKLKFI